MIFRELMGQRIPALGFGTWELEGSVCEDAVSRALDVGYRHVDTAVRYGNEASVGRAVRRSGVPRSEIFLTTKVWHDSLRHDQVIASLRDSLSRLQSDYVDLFLVHWPNPAIPLEETMAALMEVRGRGWARNIGVSNFTRAHIATVKDIIGAPIVINQVELHPYLDQGQLMNYMRSKEMVVEAYQPLASGKVMKDPTICEIACRYGKTAAQITLRWL